MASHIVVPTSEVPSCPREVFIFGGFGEGEGLNWLCQVKSQLSTMFSYAKFSVRSSNSWGWGGGVGVLRFSNEIKNFSMRSSNSKEKAVGKPSKSENVRKYCNQSI